jgi:unsaturated chondroitin disaccharide hydrolase
MKKTQFSLLLWLFMALGVVIVPLYAQELDSLVEHRHQFAQQQLANTVAEIGNPTRYPRSTLEDGTWRTSRASSWTSGFFPGALWYMYEGTGDTRWRKWAEAWTAGLENEKNDTSTHDVGFKIFSSFGHSYRLTGNTAYREVILQAARTLATRFNPAVGCIRSWDRNRFPVIIDNMMNLELLFWASKNGGDSAWYDMAVSHALQTMKNHVREDGSIYHLVDYDPDTGAISNKQVHSAGI